MKKFRNFVFSLMLVLMVAVSAQAVPYLPGVDVTQGFSLIATAPAGTAGLAFGTPALSADGTYVSIDGSFSGNGPRTAYIGISQAINTADYDSFSLFLSNNNENPWNFGLWVYNGSSYLTTAAVSMPNDHVFRQFDLNFNALGAASVQGYGYYVSETVPLLNNDRTFETGVAPVPEPGTLLLLGSGLVGLAWYGRKRKQA